METSFIQWVQEPGWNLKLGRDSEGRKILIIESPNWERLSCFLDCHTDELAASAAALEFAAVHVRYPGCKNPFGLKIPASMASRTGKHKKSKIDEIMTQSEPGAASNQPQIITPAFFASAGWISRPLWERLGKLLEQSDIKKGITRSSDKRQLYITQAAAMAVRTTAEEASTRKATDYIYLPDLDEIDQTINQQGTQAGGVRVTYRATLNGTLASNPNAIWGLFTAQTSVFEDDLHIFYRESEIIDIKEIATPPLLVTV